MVPPLHKLSSPSYSGMAIGTSDGMPGTNERGIARRMEPGGAYQMSPPSSVTYPPPPVPPLLRCYFSIIDLSSK